MPRIVLLFLPFSLSVFCMPRCICSWKGQETFVSNIQTQRGLKDVGSLVVLSHSLSVTSISVRPFSISPCPVKSQMGRERSGTSSIYLAVDVIRSKFNSLTLSLPLSRPTNDPFGFVLCPEWTHFSDRTCGSLRRDARSC